MRFSFYSLPVSQKLQPYIKSFWVLEGDLAAGEEYVHRTMATGFAEIVFHYRGIFDELIESAGIRQSRTAIHAQTSQHHRFIVREAFGIFGAQLYPFAFRQLFGIPASAFSNEMPDLASALGPAGAELEEKIMLAPDNSSRHQLLTSFFETLLENAEPDRHPAILAVRHVMQTDEFESVAKLATRFNLSFRQMERKFMEYAGFPPKLYTRIVRFQLASARYGRNDLSSLTRIGYDCGYYDQSHFIHDFKAFSGYHPGTYFGGKNEATHWRDDS